MPFDVARMRVKDAKYRIDNYINSNIQQWGEEEILQLAQKFGWEKGLSENVLSYMWVETRKEGNKIILECIWDYRGPKDEPISKWLEEGTEAHIIEAKGKLLGGSDVLRWYGKDGQPIFRPRVKHPGTNGMFIMRRAKTEGKEALKKRIFKEIKSWLIITQIPRGV